MSKDEDFDVVDVPKQYYIGFRPGTEFDTLTHPLVFACPFEKDDAAFKKRRKTCDDWARIGQPRHAHGTDWKEGTGVFMDNKPQTGFEISGWGSRYSTDNKVFDIKDPRGFSLEIYAKNLVELIQSTTIINGVVQDECIWGRRAGVNVLISTKDKNYQTAIVSKALTIKDVKIGDEVLVGNNKLIYVGPKYVMAINPNKAKEPHWVPTGLPITQEWYAKDDKYLHCVATYPCTWSANKIKDKYHVFKMDGLGEDYAILYTSPKIKGIVGHGKDITLPKICTTQTGYREESKFQSDGNIMLFDSKEEMESMGVNTILSERPARIVNGWSNPIEKNPAYESRYGYNRTKQIIDYEYILSEDERKSIRHY